MIQHWHVNAMRVTITTHALILSGKNIQTSLSTELYTPPEPTSFPLVDDLPSTDTQEPFNDSWGGSAARLAVVLAGVSPAGVVPHLAP